MKQKKFKFSGDLLTFILVAAVYAVVAYLLYGGSLTRQFSNMIIPISVYIVLAVSLNLVVGLLGELSLGHAGFMSVGLFSGCLLSIALVDVLPMAVRLPLSMVVGGLVAALFGLAVGLPALRLKGDYLAIVTLACGEIIKNIITNLDFTGGALGLNTNPIYSNAKKLLPYAVILVLLTVLVMMNLKRSKQGRAIMAIRDNRIAAESVGIDVTRYKLMVFMLAAFFAGQPACCTATSSPMSRQPPSITTCPSRSWSSWYWAAWAASRAPSSPPLCLPPCRRPCVSLPITGCFSMPSSSSSSCWPPIIPP